MSSRWKEVSRFATFVFAIALGLVFLKFLNWLPSVIQKEDLRKYRTVDEAKSELRLSEVYIPAYFPDYITWPPLEIFAQRRPFTMVMMHFMHRDSRHLALSLYQVDAEARFDPPYKLDVLFIRREMPVTIKGREGMLVVAVCTGREQCNRVSWTEGAYRITLIGDEAPEELLKIAESTR